MALFLSNEEMFDMALGGMSGERQIPHWCGNLCYVVIGAAFKVAFRYKVINRQALRAFKSRGGVVLVGNHSSYLDVAFLFVAVRPSQWVRFMARETLFKKGPGGQIISRVGAFPVKRESADLVAVKRAARMLKRGEVVGIFPEGTRRGKGGQEPALHGGAAMVAKMGKSPLLPVTVRNVENIKRKGERVRFPRVEVEFGEPIYLESFDFLPKDERLEACTWYAMRAAYALNRKVPPDMVDMTELFPDTKDYSVLLARVGAQVAPGVGG